MASDGTGVAASGAAEGAAPSPSITMFGANELRELIVQLNAWAPQVETAVRETRGAQILMEGQMARIVENGEQEMTKIIVAFQAELDQRSKADESLRQELNGLVAKLHEKFVQVETAIAKLEQSQAAAMAQAQGAAAAAAAASSQRSSPDQNAHDPWAAAAAATNTAQVPMQPPGTLLTKKFKVEPRN